jgi:hypothetical protein
MCPLATEMQDLRNIINLPEGMAVGRILNCCYYFSKSSNVLYSSVQNFYLSGPCVSFHSPDTFIDMCNFDVFNFFFLSNIWVSEVCSTEFLNKKNSPPVESRKLNFLWPIFFHSWKYWSSILCFQHKCCLTGYPQIHLFLNRCWNWGS